MYEINCYDSYGNTIDYLTQWDYNRKLIMYIDNYDLSYAPEVHFCNQKSKEALVVKSVVDNNKVTVDIPNILLQEHYSLFAYVYLSDANDESSQKTILSVTIPIRYRPKPSDYTYIENITKITAAQIEESIYNKIQKQWRKDNEYNTCRIDTVADDYITISCSGDAFKRSVRLAINASEVNFCEISRLSGWSFTRNSVYSTSTTNKVIVDVNIENTRYTDLEVLKTEGFEFRNLVITYKVLSEESTADNEIVDCVVTLVLTPDTIQIIETPSDNYVDNIVTSRIQGNYITPIAEHGTNLFLFYVNNGLRCYAEKIEKLGNSVIKTIGIRGVF